MMSLASSVCKLKQPHLRRLRLPSSGILPVRGNEWTAAPNDPLGCTSGAVQPSQWEWHKQSGPLSVVLETGVLFTLARWADRRPPVAGTYRHGKTTLDGGAFPAFEDGQCS